MTVTVPDAESAAEGDYEDAARLSLAAFSQAKKRVGAEMSTVVTVPCTPAMADLDTAAMNVDSDPDATQVVMESACKKRKEEDVTKEIMEGAARKAVKEVVAQIEMREQRLTDHLDCSVKK